MSMRAIIARWERFWFTPVPVRRVAALRVLVCAFALFDIAVVSSYIARYARVDGQFYDPILIVRLLNLPRPDPTVTTLVEVLLIVSLAAAAVGLATRLALCVATPLYIWWFATFYSFGAFQHGRVTIVFALVVLAIAPSGRAYCLDAVIARARRARPGEPLPPPSDERDALAGWALRVLCVLLVLIYVFSAWAKIKQSGIGWVTGGGLESVIEERGTVLGELIVGQTWLLALMSGAALALEATAWVCFFGGRVRDGWLASAAAFHFGCLALLRINFLPYVLTYAAFYRLERAAGWMGRAARRLGHRAGPRLDVLYDGNCHLCVRTVTVLDSLDWLGRLRTADAAVATLEPPDAMYTLDGDTGYRGYRAFRRVARALPALWPLVPLAYLPGAAPLGERVYEYVAVNRRRISACSIDGCALGDEPTSPMAAERVAR
jgi:predicted DCC family thiol-disulfide oxidoreductase YuxK